MKNQIKHLLVALVLLSILNLQPSAAFAQGTAFTYEGQLSASGTNANGSYDFTFALFNSSSTNTGQQVGNTLTNLDVGVTNGLFNVTLNFGGVFTGNATWLAMSVRSNGAGSYTAMTPLQQLTPTPYAIFANTASNVSGTVPAAQLSGTVGNSQLANNSITVSAGTGLTGGGAVALGGSTALANTGVLSVTGNADITASTAGGAVTLGDTATSAATASTIVKRDGTGSFSAANLTLNGALTLPATGVSPDIIYSGSSLLLYGDNNGNFFAGQAGNSATTGYYNTANGFGALSDNTTGDANTANGYQALYLNTTGFDNTAKGVYALYNNTSGYYNTANGYQALYYNTTGYGNTANGVDALYSNTSGSDDTAYGVFALYNNTTGLQNTANGFGALFENTTGSYNTANGYNALDSNTSGNFNTAVGAYTFELNTTGSCNTANGFQALNSNTNGNFNTANGFAALYENTTGNQNTADGMGALYSLTTGNFNIALGYDAGFNFTENESSNIDIGNSGVRGDSNIIRIGTEGTQTACYLAGTVYANGVALSSDRNAKENFTPLDAKGILEKVTALPMTQWNYKNHSAAVRHIGPMAQDFHQAFQLNGDDDTHISVVDEGGVALAAIQGLNQKLETENAELKQQNESLAARLNDLEAAVKSAGRKEMTKEFDHG